MDFASANIQFRLQGAALPAFDPALRATIRRVGQESYVISTEASLFDRQARITVWHHRSLLAAATAFGADRQTESRPRGYCPSSGVFFRGCPQRFGFQHAHGHTPI